MAILGDVFKRITGGEYEADEDTNYIDDMPTIAGPRYESGYSAKNSKVLSIAATAHLQVIVFKPKEYKDVGEIADNFKNKKTVVLNLDNTDPTVIVRLIDFLGGVAYAMDGELKKISTSTYMIVPFNVDISGDTIEELESSTDFFS